MTLSRAQLAALRWLAESDGCAALDRFGRMVATSRDGARAKQAPQTFLRLMISGHVAPHFIEGHIGITKKGFDALGARP